MSLKILYLGDSSPYCTARHRALALERCGHKVLHIDPMSAVRWDRLNVVLHHRSGYLFTHRKVCRYVLGELNRLTNSFDLVWVDNGQIVPRSLLQYLRARYSSKLINYNCDDPTGSRDGTRWLTLRRAIPEYDFMVAVRNETAEELVRFGAKRVQRVFMSCDEIAHAKRPWTPLLETKWACDLIFAGTWMPERGPFMMELIHNGLTPVIYGNRWQKAPEWPKLKMYWRGSALQGDDYALALQGAKVVLGLLSKGNRDQHTQRTAEAPYLGAAFCAEDTPEHRQLFEHGRDAFLFNSATEAAHLIKALLLNNELRSSMAKNGRERIISAGLTNQRIVQGILDQIKIQEPA